MEEGEIISIMRIDDDEYTSQLYEGWEGLDEGKNRRCTHV